MTDATSLSLFLSSAALLIYRSKRKHTSTSVHTEGDVGEIEYIVVQGNGHTSTYNDLSQFDSSSGSGNCVGTRSLRKRISSDLSLGIIITHTHKHLQIRLSKSMTIIFL